MQNVESLQALTTDHLRPSTEHSKTWTTNGRLGNIPRCAAGQRKEHGVHADPEKESIPCPAACGGRGRSARGVVSAVPQCRAQCLAADTAKLRAGAARIPSGLRW